MTRSDVDVTLRLLARGFLIYFQGGRQALRQYRSFLAWNNVSDRITDDNDELSPWGLQTPSMS